jgi:hypothetical protein
VFDLNRDLDNAIVPPILVTERYLVAAVVHRWPTRMLVRPNGKRMIAYHLTTHEALEEILREGMQPRIGPRSSKLGETQAAIYCFATREALEDGLSNWLGDAFDNEEALVILEIECPDAALDPDMFEIVLTEAVPACSIVRVLSEDFEEIAIVRPGM